jgi:hypothetical protein
MAELLSIGDGWKKISQSACVTEEPPTNLVSDTE